MDGPGSGGGSAGQDAGAIVLALFPSEAGGDGPLDGKDERVPRILFRVRLHPDNVNHPSITKRPAKMKQKTPSELSLSDVRHRAGSICLTHCPASDGDDDGRRCAWPATAEGEKGEDGQGSA